jgi:hypothetical protein
LIPRYRVGFVFTRCFLQKRLTPQDGVSLIPLAPSGSAGTIHDAAQALAAARFAFNRQDLANTLTNFRETGHNVLIEFAGREAASFQVAIDQAEAEAHAAASALAVVSANPAIPLVAFAEGLVDSGVKFFVPKDRQIMHGTNIAGFLDAVPALRSGAATDPKLAVLLGLYRASLRETEIDNQLLLQLILLEEASDQEPGNSFAQRLRAYANRHGLTDSFAHAAAQAGVTLPPGKDAIDLMVALRNAAAHNGAITEGGLRDYRAEWAVPLVAAKAQAHHFVNEALRVLFCILVDCGPGKMMTKITGPMEIRFD